MLHGQVSERFNLAWELADQGEWERAIDDARHLIAQDPRCYRAYELIGRLAAGPNLHEQAQTYFRKLISESPSNPWPWYGLGELASHSVNKDRAGFFSRCIALDREAWPCYVGLGAALQTDNQLMRNLPRSADRRWLPAARAMLAIHTRHREMFESSLRELRRLDSSKTSAELRAEVEVLSGSLSDGSTQRCLDNASALSRARGLFLALNDRQRARETELSEAENLFYAGRLDELARLVAAIRSSGRPVARGTESSLLTEEIRISRRNGDDATALDLMTRRIRLLEGTPILSYNLFIGIASVYSEQGDYIRAYENMRRAADLAKAPAEKAFVLRALGLLYAAEGKYGRALEASQSSVDVFRTAGMSWQAGAGLRNVAEIYSLLGDFPHAIGLLKQSLVSAQHQRDLGEQQGCLTALGETYVQMDNRREALFYLTQAETLAARTNYTEARLAGQLSIAMLYRAEGRSKDATAYATVALTHARQLHFESEAADAQIELGEIALADKQPKLALRNFGLLLNRTLTAAQSMSVETGTAHALIRLGELQNARRHLTAAAEILESGRASIARRELRVNFLARNSSVYDDAVLVAAELGDVPGSLAFSERGRARAYLDALNDVKSAGVRAHLASAAEIQKSLAGRNSIAVEYLLGNQQSWLWVISGEGAQMYKLPPASQIEELVGRFRASISRPDRTPRPLYETLGRELFDVLCGPAAKSIRRARNVIISPDGALNNFPFEALITSSGSFLTEEVTVSYVPSLSSLVSQSAAASGPLPLELAAFGAPATTEISIPPVLAGVYRHAGLTLLPLPHADQEAEFVASLFAADKVRLFQGTKATTKALASLDLGSFRRLHFATHAIYDERFPALSGIILSSGGDDDGILRASDILKFRLNADLVVLSGCQTGSGPILRGEGMTGFSRAFLDAGARRVVVSAWDVNDMAALHIMEKFYQTEREGRSYAASLRQAKVEMIQSGSIAYRDPYYWAPFLLIGSL